MANLFIGDKECLRFQLSANIETTIEFGYGNTNLEITNEGPSDVYFITDDQVTIDGPNCIRIPVDYNYSYRPKKHWSNARFISVGNSKIQLIEVK